MARKSWWLIGSVLACGLATLLPSLPAAGVTGRVVNPSNVATVLEVRNVQADTQTVRATLVNHSPRALENVRLLIRHQWLWRNEKNPGTDNPGRSWVYTLPDQVPAGGTYSLEVAIQPPLPRRNDGRFVTTVEVLGFTEVGF